MNFKFLNKAGASLMAAAMLMNGMAVMNTGTAFAEGTTKYEFEDAKISGDVTVENDSDTSGGKFLKMTDTGTIELNFSVENDGTYNFIIHCGGIGGAKQQNLYIDGVSQGALGIPESDGFDAVKVSSVKLSKGEHTMLIEKSWGWSNFDYLEVEDASSVPIVATQTTPCDPKATAETKNLMSYLASVYGNNILSGQQEIYMYGPHDFEYEFEYLNDLTGHYPAIRGFDFLNCANILYGSEDGTADRMIDWVNNKNGIVTASWHITVPKKMAGYKVGDTNIDWSNATYAPSETDFVTSNVLKEGTVEREYYLTALGALAEQIQKLQDAGVPLIFRPLHEAEGGGGETGSWFWWGKDGSAVYKELWKLTYKTLTEDYGLHNIIWEWNSYNFTTSADWYPGDEYVDIIGYDKYNCTKYLEENNWNASYEHDDSAISPVFYGIMEKYNNAKMVAMAENDCFSTVENLTSDRAGWLYFCTWYDGGSSTTNFLSDPLFNTEEDTINMYQSDYCITLDELPADLYSSEAKPVQTTTTSSGNSSTGSTTTTTATTKPSDDDFKFELKKYTVEMEDGFGDTMTIKIKGASGASIGGALGYSNGPTPDDWVNIEWKGNADKDGNLVIEIDTSEIPADVKTGEIQIWWSNVTVDKKTTDKDCSLISYDDVAVGNTGEDDILYGDANEDGKVTLADAVLIMQALSNPNNYKLSEQAQKNADVYGDGDGVTPRDALIIQLVDLEVLTASDLPVSADFDF
ncbi:MAG: dockerin type I domain-containing protein [Ruminococcus flavefaciens]|nr:dockerin type I domain-containing protein [Ruminococcus flavefaciens]